MKKSQDQKEFENFARKKYPSSFDTGGMYNIYIDHVIRFAFECWMESKRIQADHAKG